MKKKKTKCIFLIAQSKFITIKDTHITYIEHQLQGFKPVGAKFDEVKSHRNAWFQFPYAKVKTQKQEREKKNRVGKFVYYS